MTSMTSDYCSTCHVDHLHLTLWADYNRLRRPSGDPDPDPKPEPPPTNPPRSPAPPRIPPRASPCPLPRTPPRRSDVDPRPKSFVRSEAIPKSSFRHLPPTRVRGGRQISTHRSIRFWNLLISLIARDVENI